MNDIYLQWGGDLVVSSSGDLAISSAADTINQRVYRRLLTNPGDYLWNIDYGGGLARFVGNPANPSAIEAVVRAQLLLETSIPSSPVPQVSASIVDVTNGYVVAQITYADPTSMEPVQLSVTAS